MRRVRHDRSDGHVDAALEVHGFIPAATDFAPSRTIACARTVAVVVPSPATVLVLVANMVN